MPPPGQAQRADAKFIVFEQFEKMNTQSVREALSEKELAWLENLQPIAPNNLTTVPGVGTQLTTIAETIYLQFYANLFPVDYIISFTTSGSAWATDISNGNSTQFAPPGSFSQPDMTVWQSSVVLFVDPTAGYSAWNGTVFARKGGVSPVITLTFGGSGYTSPPTVTISGGSGSGATAVATVGSPQVTAVNVITGGSQYSSPPTVVFSGGGGSGAAGTAIIANRSVNTLTLTGFGAYGSAPGFPIPPVPSIFFTGGGGSGAAAVVTSFQNDPATGTYFVAAIALTSAGSGYTSAPSVGFTQVGATVLPTAVSTVGNGAVTGVSVTNGGSGYTSAPAVALTGGGGTGATAAAVIGGSFVTSVSLTSTGGGYLPSDVLTVGFSGGGGSGATATAHVWPFAAANGTTLAIFGGRVWMASGQFVQYTGTKGYDDFDAANAAGSLTISDTDLQHVVTALRNYNNYLFIMGDQSVKQIGAVSLNAAGNVTLFTILTLSSDQGSIYPSSCGSFNRLFFFANTNGIYAVFGSSVQKVSDDLDGIFRLIDFSQPPRSAIVDINNIHHIAYLVRYRDPETGTRSIMLAFNGKKWFVISQGDNLKSIVATSTLAKGRITTCGSSGNDITQLFGNPTGAVAVKLQTSLSHHGNAVQNKKIIGGGLAVTLASGTANLNVTFDTENGTSTKVYPLVAGFQLPGGSAGAEGSGRYLGMTITGTLAGATFNSAAIEEQENALWKSGPGG